MAIRSNESASKAHEAASGANEEVTIVYWAVSGYMAVLVAVSEYAKYVRGFQMIMNEETKSKILNNEHSNKVNDLLDHLMTNISYQHVQYLFM